MKKLWNMVCDEIHRSRFYYLTILALVFFSQGLIAFLAFRYEWLPKTIYRISSSNPAFFMTIGAAILAMLIYSFYTWFREWKLQGRFIYRLMILPVDRFYIGLSKLISLLLMIGGLLTLQVVFLYIIDFLARIFMGPEKYLSTYISLFLYSHSNVAFFETVLPLHFGRFFLNYLLGIGFLVGAFNIQIIGFSCWKEKRLRTIVYISAYVLIEVLVFAAYLYVKNHQLLVSSEAYILSVVIGLVNLMVNLILMKYISKYKMSV